MPAFIDVRRMPGAVTDRLRVAAGLAAAGSRPADSGAASLKAAPALGDVGAPTEEVEPELFEDTLWGRVRRQLSEEFPQPLYATWIQPLKPVHQPTPAAPTLLLTAADEFCAEWVGRRHARRISELAAADLGVNVSVTVATLASAERTAHRAG